MKPVLTSWFVPFLVFWGLAQATERVIEVGPALIPGQVDEAGWYDEQAGHFQQLQASISILPQAAASLVLTDEDIQEIARANAEAGPGTPHKVGLVRQLGYKVDLSTLDPDLVTERLAPFAQGWMRRNEAGGISWALRLDAENTGAVRLHLTHLRLPNQVRIYLYNGEGEVRGPYEGNADSLWTHSIPGVDLYLQIEIPATVRTSLGAVRFRVEEVLLVEPDSQAFCSYNVSCVVDGGCYDSTEWPAIDQARKAIAHIQFIEDGSGYICTGGLVNDTVADTNIPYFLTAHHCLSTQAGADSLETFFNYKTSYCGASCPSPGSRSTLGATLLSTSAANDHSLLRLAQDPPAGSLLLGWTTADVATTSQTLYRLSHPRGAPQAYSKYRVDPSSFTCSSLPRGSFIYSQDQLGATEGGSSGSPVLNAAGQIVGQLYGACGSNLSDKCDADANRTVDGAFQNYYAQVQPWLNPSPGQPSVTTNAASGLSQTGATLNASVNPNGLSTTLYYDYGTTTSYGSTLTYGNLGSGTTPVSAPQPISGLSCDTGYHFRARATNSAGTTYGANQSFTTSACALTPLDNGQILSNLAGGINSERHYYIDVPSAQSQLLIEMWGGSGDADLYVRLGSQPTLSSYDCRPWLYGNDENCAFSNPTGGPYYVMVQGYEAYSGLSLRATYTNSDTCPDDLVLEDGEEDGTASYRAMYSITAGPNYRIAATGNLTLQAGDQIRLLAGFQVEAGGRFHAILDAAACATAATLSGALNQKPALPGHANLEIAAGSTGEFAAPAHSLTWSMLPAALRKQLHEQEARIGDAQQDVTGTTIVFSTEAPLLEQDNNSHSDIYGYALEGDRLHLLSLGLEGQAANGPSDQPRLDGLGQRLIYRSRATNLVTGTQNPSAQLYHQDLRSGALQRLTTTPWGEPGAGDSGQALLAGDWVIYRTEAANLAASGPGLYRQHLFEGGMRQAIGLDEWGKPDSRASGPAADAMGTEIAYQRPAADGSMQIYLNDGVQAERVSPLSDAMFGRLDHCCVAISSDGDYLAYREGAEEGQVWLHLCQGSRCHCRRLAWPADPRLHGQAPQFTHDGEELLWINPMQGPGLPEVLYRVNNSFAPSPDGP